MLNEFDYSESWNFLNFTAAASMVWVISREHEIIISHFMGLIEQVHVLVRAKLVTLMKFSQESSLVLAGVHFTNDLNFCFLLGKVYLGLSSFWVGDLGWLGKELYFFVLVERSH